jgi:peptidoglycan biosynthesis protein MviN/MurJ (putative lipid II flippase)
MNTVWRLAIKLLKNRKGSLTLETIIIFPIFLTLLLTLVQIMILFNLKYNLQSLNSEVVREISSNWSVTTLIKGHLPSQISKIIDNKYSSLFMRKSLSISPLIKRYIDKPLSVSRIKTKIIRVPTKTSNNIAIQLVYRYEIQLPFYRKAVYIKTFSSEEVWGR